MRQALKYTFRAPAQISSDAKAMQRIARDSGVLEVNTGYAYLVFVEHFGADGCIVVERDENVVGYVKGYRPPTHRDTVFVWQIGVDASERGQGLGKQLLYNLSKRLVPDGVSFLEASVTPSNVPSRKMFRGFARDIGVDCVERDFFSSDMFPGKEAHEKEDLFRIGPFSSKNFP